MKTKVTKGLSSKDSKVGGDSFKTMQLHERAVPKEGSTIKHKDNPSGGY